jgi:hypothetical protein
MSNIKSVEMYTVSGVLKTDIINNRTSIKFHGNNCEVSLENPESQQKYQEMIDICDCKLSELHYLRVAGGGKLFIRRK